MFSCLGYEVWREGRQSIHMRDFGIFFSLRSLFLFFASGIFETCFSRSGLDEVGPDRIVTLLEDTSCDFHGGKNYLTLSYLSRTETKYGRVVHHKLHSKLGKTVRRV